MRISDWSSDVCSSDLWRSQFSHRDRDIHYTQLAMWEPIFRIPGLVFVNLFYEKCEEEIAEAEQRFGIGIHRWDDIDLKNDMEAAFALTTTVAMLMWTRSETRRGGTEWARPCRTQGATVRK